MSSALSASIAKAVKTAADNAPYLAQSLAIFPDVGAMLSRLGPDAALAQMLAELPHDIQTLSDEMALLRVYKRRAHLAIALSDIAQIWDWDAVTEALSVIADTAIARLMQTIAREQDIVGSPDNPVPGLFILAVGKYGARELNYSSDVDFCVFYDPDIIQLPNMARAERTLIKIVQSLIAGLERITAEGYVFRTDLRLRPDPRSNAVAVSTVTAERYYETLGQNWERAAMIKARVCGGDMAAGEAFIAQVLTPFIWRRSLDYAAIEDIQSIKRQIHASKSITGLSVPGHHLKLGYGGIREIEFYAQTQQLILGGRDPNLRVMRTVDALSALRDVGAVEADICADLTADYAKLRKGEHAVQMMMDAQTHSVPETTDGRAAMAALMGYSSPAEFDADILTTITRVNDHYTNLFPEAESLSLPEGSLSFTGVEPGPATLRTLAALGFDNAERVWTDMAHWLGGRIPATRSERARELLTRFAPQLISICAENGREQAGQADAAFDVFARFFVLQNGGVALLSMFLNAPERLSDIIGLMLRSPRIADMIANNPAILDAMIDPQFLDIRWDRLGQGYAALVARAGDFEEQMNSMRRALHEDQFRVNASVLSGRLPLIDSARALSILADKTVSAMLPAAHREAARISGDVAGDYAVIAMGKAGGRELSLSSDLDVMVLYAPYDSADPNAQRQFTKLTQRFVSALSAVTAQGRLYEIDMALRPSGRSGPVAVSLDAFTRYYREKAWVWEFMALSRARVMAASTAEFEIKISALIKDALSVPRPDLDAPKDIADMLLRLRADKPARGSWDIKQCEGGLRDVEFIAQKMIVERRSVVPNMDGSPPVSTLDMLTAARGNEYISADDHAGLRAAALFYMRLTQAFTLTRGSISGDISTPELSAAAALMGVDCDALRTEFNAHRHTVQRAVNNYILCA